jgi:deoxyadenosine/deoxycytidine kinase
MITTKAFYQKVNIEDYLLGFTEKFKDFVYTVEIDSNFKISICLKDEFQCNKKIQSEIKKFMKKLHGETDHVIFTDALPF